MAKAKRIRIKCKAPATLGIKLVLATRFEELLEWREPALDWTDPEGVHSMRVASRRLRSALRDFMPYVRKRRLAAVLKPLKNLAAALGQVRDHDVAILGLEEIHKQVPRESATALKELIETRKAIRDEARQDLQAVLADDGLPELQTEFVAHVGEAVARSERKNRHARREEEELTFAEMSRTILLSRLKEFEKLSNALFRPNDAAALHNLRISVKRFRYALELFQPCWGRSLGTDAKRAARIQTALGDIHDCDVWIESVGKQIVRARKQNEHERVKGLVSLLSYFTKLRTKYLRRALARWNEWEAHDSSGKLRATLAPKEEGELPVMPMMVEGDGNAAHVAGEQMRQGL
jgi:CHAD domain-containing protein